MDRITGQQAHKCHTKLPTRKRRRLRPAVDELSGSSLARKMTIDGGDQCCHATERTRQHRLACNQPLCLADSGSPVRLCSPIKQQAQIDLIMGARRNYPVKSAPKSSDNTCCCASRLVHDQGARDNTSKKMQSEAARNYQASGGRPLALRLVLVGVALVTMICSPQPIHCQRNNQPQQPQDSLGPAAQGLQAPNQLQRQQFLAGGGGGGGEAAPGDLRADPTMIKPNQAYEQLVNLLSNYANSQNNNINRRLPLPLNGRGSQLPQPLGAGNQQGPQQQQQQQPGSAPVNPFSQNNNNNRRINFPAQNQQQSGQQLFFSSSPPTLTLNRIPQLLPQNLQQNQNNRQQQFGGAPSALQPINTIPLGSINNNQQPQPSTNGQRLNGPLPNLAGMMPPPRGMPPRGQQQFNQVAPPQVTLNRIPIPSSTPLPATPNNSQRDGPAMKPITGFAPSGPPPSQLTPSQANNAMVVVQSPQQQNSNQMQAANKPQQEPASRPEDKTTTTAAAASTETPPTGASADEVANGDGNDAAAQSPSSKAPESPVSSSPSPAVDLDKAATGDERPTTTSGLRPDVSWNPVESVNRSGNPDQQAANRNRVTLAPSPDIVTVPPGYNPDNPNNQQPQNYDISVSAQMGTPVQAQRPQVQPTSSGDAPPVPVGPSASQSGPTPVLASSTILEESNSAATAGAKTVLVASEASATSEPAAAPPTIAPTAVTTIIWSPTPETLSTASHPPAVSQRGPQSPPSTRIRDNSLLLNDEPAAPQSSQDAGVVYGKPQTRDSKPTPPPPVSGQPASIESSVPAAGRPYIQPVQLENQVRPFASAGSQQQQQQSLLKSNHHPSSASSASGPAPFRPSRPLGGSQSSSPMHVGSGFTITAAGNQTMPTGDIQDYVAAQPPLLVPHAHHPASPAQASGSFQVSGGGGDSQEPTISAHGGQDPANFELNASEVRAAAGETPHLVRAPATQANGSTSDSGGQQPGSSSTVAPRIRRPTFKPKPAVPPIRIDSCIVDDDSSCDQSHNERCVTEYGISSCHCKPGYARLSQLRGFCSPVSALQLSMKIDRLSDDRRLAYNHTLDNSNTEEYQYLEFEAIQALASAFQQTSLAKQFKGARVNKFFERKGKVWANMSVNFDLNNLTRSQDKIQSVAAQELLKVTQQPAARQRPLGDSTIMLDGSKEAVSRLTDINECADRDLNDCSKFAACTNEFGGFQCQCLAGYEDKYQASEDKSKHGRVCLGCTASYCSNRGECSISEGQKQCKCRPNFVGARCDYDTEVLAVAVGGSIIGIIILIITCWCLYIFNRRWKREQQKMDAMSATSGLTYNYVNSASTNSLMSPTRMIGGLHRSGGHQVGAMAANYGRAIANGTRGGVQQHYAPDQQAIVGSTSSGSSAASQPIGCGNPYTTGGYQQYEDAGLLIASASTGSSEQTSPTSNSYRGITGASSHQNMLSQWAGNAYTLSGHHHHQLHHMQHGGQQLHMHPTHGAKPPHHHHQLTQFHPAADYRTLNTSAAMHCMPPQANEAYESRWRTLQQDHNKQSALVGYYLVS